jgi:hypothetical protein
MGTQTWMAIAIITTEVLIVFKFDWETVTKPFPPDIAFYWLIFLSALTLYTIFHFILRPLYHSIVYADDKKKK